MDLSLLNHHAQRYGRWTMNVSATQVLVCSFQRMPTGTPRYKYHLNGKPLSIHQADRLIEKAFGRSMAS